MLSAYICSYAKTGEKIFKTFPVVSGMVQAG
jgi:hypothetical protein